MTFLMWWFAIGSMLTLLFDCAYSYHIDTLELVHKHFPDYIPSSRGFYRTLEPMQLTKQVQPIMYWIPVFLMSLFLISLMVSIPLFIYRFVAKHEIKLKKKDEEMLSLIKQKYGEHSELFIKFKRTLASSKAYKGLEDL